MELIFSILSIDTYLTIIYGTCNIYEDGSNEENPLVTEIEKHT